MREKTPQQDMPDLESMASATECTGILPALSGRTKISTKAHAHALNDGR